MLAIFHVLLVAIPLWLAWSSYARSRVSVSNPTRFRVAAVGLAAISVAGVGFLGMEMHLVMLGGREGHWGVYRAWALPGAAVSLCAPLLLLAARGRSRVFGVATGMWVAFLWYLSTM